MIKNMLSRDLWPLVQPFSVERMEVPADHVGLRYGPHERNVLDVWVSERNEPAPLLVFIHGGGFRAGDRYHQWPMGMFDCLRRAGVTVASIEYRFSMQASYPAPMLDGARALQFLRCNAARFNIDKNRVGLSGVSAGGGISLWVALNQDMADPAAADPVARESTAVDCVFCVNTQSSYDVRVLREMGGPASRCEAIRELHGLKLEDLDRPPADIARGMEQSSALTHVSASSPPVYMLYTHENLPIEDDTEMDVAVHHPKFGELLEARMAHAGRECVVTWRGGAAAKVNYIEFLFKHLGIE